MRPCPEDWNQTGCSQLYLSLHTHSMCSLASQDDGYQGLSYDTQSWCMMMHIVHVQTIWVFECVEPLWYHQQQVSDGAQCRVTSSFLLEWKQPRSWWCRIVVSWVLHRKDFEALRISDRIINLLRLDLGKAVFAHLKLDYRIRTKNISMTSSKAPTTYFYLYIFQYYKSI